MAELTRDLNEALSRLWTLVRPQLAIFLHIVRRRPFRFAPLKVDEPQNDAAVAFAGLTHSPHSVHYRGLDLDEAVTPVTLHRPSR